MKPFFRKKQMMSGVYSIAGEAVIRYLIIGEHHALLFDTGYGFGDLASFVKSLTDLPLYVVNSHIPLPHRQKVVTHRVGKVLRLCVSLGDQQPPEEKYPLYFVKGLPPGFSEVLGLMMPYTSISAECI